MEGRAAASNGTFEGGHFGNADSFTSQFILPQKYEVVSYLSQQAGPVVLITVFRQTTKLSFLWTSQGNIEKFSMPEVILSKPVQVSWIHAAKSCSFLISVDSRLMIVLLTFPLLLTAIGAIFFSSHLLFLT